MLFKILTVFLAIGAACGSAVPSKITEETTLADFLLNSPALRAAETFNAGCFDYYLPLIKGHADQLTVDFEICQETYNNAFVLIDGSYTYARDELTESVRTSCGSLLLCDAEKSNKDAFECLMGAGPPSSKDLDKVSDKAADHTSSLLEEVANIKKTQDECELAATRTYKANHAQSWDDLNGCIADPDWEYPTTESVF